MARLAKFLAALLAGVALGIVATQWMVHADPPFGLRSGSWTAWPSSGNADIDPYAKAIDARTGQIPLAAANGLAFLARTDDKGAALNSRCAYVIAGPTPQAQYWTIAVLDPDGSISKDPLVRHGFTSAEPVRDATGNFAIELATSVQPGNWLPLPADQPFALLMSFYDTPLTAALLAGAEPPPLPSISRRSCA